MRPRGSEVPLHHDGGVELAVRHGLGAKLVAVTYRLIGENSNEDEHSACAQRSIGHLTLSVRYTHTADARRVFSTFDSMLHTETCILC